VIRVGTLADVMIVPIKLPIGDMAAEAPGGVVGKYVAVGVVRPASANSELGSTEARGTDSGTMEGRVSVVAEVVVIVD